MPPPISLFALKQQYCSRQRSLKALLLWQTLKLKDTIASGHGGRRKEWDVFQRSQILLQNWTLDTTVAKLSARLHEATRSSVQGEGRVSRVPRWYYMPHLLFCWCSCSLLFLQNESLNSRNKHFIPLPAPFSTASHLLVFVLISPGLEHQILSLSPQLLLHPQQGKKGVEGIAARGGVEGGVMYNISAQWLLERRNKNRLSVRVHSFRYPLRRGMRTKRKAQWSMQQNASGDDAISDKLWPVDQIWPASCFHGVRKLWIVWRWTLAVDLMRRITNSEFKLNEMLPPIQSHSSCLMHLYHKLYYILIESIKILWKFIPTQCLWFFLLIPIA